MINKQTNATAVASYMKNGNLESCQPHDTRHTTTTTTRGKKKDDEDRTRKSEGDVR